MMAKFVSLRSASSELRLYLASSCLKETKIWIKNRPDVVEINVAYAVKANFTLFITRVNYWKGRKPRLLGLFMYIFDKIKYILLFTPLVTN